MALEIGSSKWVIWTAFIGLLWFKVGLITPAEALKCYSHSPLFKFTNYILMHLKHHSIEHTHIHKKKKTLIGLVSQPDQFKYVRFKI